MDAIKLFDKDVTLNAVLYIIQQMGGKVDHYYVQNDKEADMDYLSKSDQMCLDDSIKKCKDKNFGELTEMSHGLAWQSTAKDRPMAFADILREEGDSEGYVNYISNKLKLESSFR